MNATDIEIGATPLPTTTISTIAVRAEPHTTIVIAMLRSIDSLELRIDEMKPKLLEIGTTMGESQILLKTHNDLSERLKEKQQQVEDLLQRAENLVGEQKDLNDMAVYEAMAMDLGVAWKELSRKLELRGFILHDTFELHKMSERHQKLFEEIGQLFQKIRMKRDSNSLPKYVDEMRNHFKKLLELTTSGIDLGCRVITQIRVLGGLADNDDRPREVVKACLIIEDLMLKMAQRWERIETRWSRERPKLEQIIADLEIPVQDEKATVDGWTKRLGEIANWLDWARDRSKGVESGAGEADAINTLLVKAKYHETGLQKIAHDIQKSHFTSASTLIGQAGELLELYDLLVKRLEERLLLLQRLEQFFSIAETLPAYLQKIHAEIEAEENPSIAGELGPLAQQKAIAVIDEGQYLVERLGTEHPDVPLIAKKLKELKFLTMDVVHLAKGQIKRAKSEGLERLSTQIQSVDNWIKHVPESFFSSNLDPRDSSFLSNHKKFFTEVNIKEQELQSISANSKKLPLEEKKKVDSLNEELVKLKSVLETRIQFGSTFNQVMKLDRNLDGILQELRRSMEEPNIHFPSEQAIRTQIQSLQEYYLQHQHHASKLESLREEIIRLESKSPFSVIVQGTCESVVLNIQERRLQVDETIRRWQAWEKALVEKKNQNKRIVEETEALITEIKQHFFQEKIGDQKQTYTAGEIDPFITRMQICQEKLMEIKTFAEKHNNKEQNERLQKLLNELMEVRQQLESLFSEKANSKEINLPEGYNFLDHTTSLQSQEQKQGQFQHHEEQKETVVKTNFNEQSPTGSAPKLIMGLEPAEVIEGSRHVFAASLRADPKPSIRWFRDSTELHPGEQKYGMIYSANYEEANLVINSVSPSDTGNYCIRAENIHGAAESWALLQVIPKSEELMVHYASLSHKSAEETQAEAAKISIDLLQMENKSADEQIIESFLVDEKKETAVLPPTPPPKSSQQTSSMYHQIPITLIQQEKQHQQDFQIPAEVVIQKTETSLSPNAPATALSTSTHTMQTSGYAGSDSNTNNNNHLSFQQTEFVITHDQSALSTSPKSKYNNVLEELNRRNSGADTIGATGGILRNARIEEFGPVGYSSIANAPEFLRPFHHEYTLEEGEKCEIECSMLGNPRPKVQWFFNDQPIKSNVNFVEFTNVGDTYTLNFTPARLEHAGYYRILGENVRGRAESLTLIHIRPKSMIPRPGSRRSGSRGSLPRGQMSWEQQQPKNPTVREIPLQIVVQQQQQNRSYSTPPQPLYVETPSPCSIPDRQFPTEASSPSPAAYYLKKAMNPGRPLSESPNKMTRGHQQPPHFIQTIVSCVTNIGDETKFEAVITGHPSPTIQWSKDGVEIQPQQSSHFQCNSQGGRASLTIPKTTVEDAGKYMCTARNSSGVATSSAQLCVRPRTLAPDFIWRLVSEEVAEGDPLKWTVKVNGEPEPTVTWLKDGQQIRESKTRIRLLRDGPQIYSLLIDGIQQADAGQITCVLENVAGEARSTADLVIRGPGSPPGNYIHITKVTQEKQVRGEEVARAQSVTIEPPLTPSTNPSPECFH